MNPDDLADLKRQQIELARIALNDAIPSEYKDYKKEKSQKVNNLRNKYDETVLDTLDIVKDSLEGKTKKPLAETLISLIKDDDALLYSANTINKGDVYSSDYDRSHVVPSVINIVDVMPKLKIKIIDDFLKTKKKLIDGKPSLQDVMKINNSLYDGLMGIFDKIVVDVAAMYSQLTIGEVADIAISEKLHPDDNIKLNEVEELNSYIRIKIDKIEDTITKMIRAYDQLGYTDERLARMFGLNVAQVKDRKKQKSKKNWTEEYKARNRDATIASYQECYGLTYDDAALLYDDYDKHFAEYADQQGWDEEEGSYQYFMMLASIGYGDSFIWRPTAGLLDTGKTENNGYTVQKDSEWYKRMKEMGLSDSKINQLGALNTNTVYEQSQYDENGDGVVNEDDKIATNYQNNDFIHMCAAIATQLNPNPSVLADFATGEGQDKYSSYEGDAVSGLDGINYADTRANTDAYNIARRIKEGNLDPFAAIDGYANDVLNKGVNPAQEFIEHYEVKDGDGIDMDDSYTYDEKLEAFKEDLKNWDPTLATWYLQDGDELTNYEKYWGFFQRILDGNLTAKDA